MTAHPQPRPRPRTRRRELRARRDALADRVAELTFDLGGLTYEAAARGRQRDFRLMPSRRWATVSQRSIADSSDS